MGFLKRMDNSDYKVLLVEPFKERNTVLTNILIELDFQVISVKNIETALKKLLEKFHSNQ